MAPRTGSECKLYYNSATHATPTWVEIDAVENVSVDDLSLNTGEVAVRLSDWVHHVPGKFSASLSFNYIYGANTTVFDVLRAAFFAKTVKEYYIADGASGTSGTEGLRIGLLLTEHPLDQPLQEASTVNFTARPAWFEESGSLVAPDWHIIP